MTGPSEFVALSPARHHAAVAALLESYSVSASLHLDHGHEMYEAEACLAAGYTSVMLDCSTRPFEQNAAALRALVAQAHPLGVTVEGEIGHVGMASATTVESTGDSVLTEASEAAAYVEATGVDALAVAIGNAHGTYTRLPQLDFARLAEIRAATNVPLVLHGGSGTPDADLRQAISLGISKVNVATDLVTAYRQSLLDQWQSGRNLWAPLAIGEALSPVAAQVEGLVPSGGRCGPRID